MEIKRKPVVISGERRAYATGTSAVGARGFVTLSGAVGENAESGEIPESIGEQTTIARSFISKITRRQALYLALLLWPVLN